MNYNLKRINKIDYPITDDNLRMVDIGFFYTPIINTTSRKIASDAKRLRHIAKSIILHSQIEDNRMQNNKADNCMQTEDIN